LSRLRNRVLFKENKAIEADTIKKDEEAKLEADTIKKDEEAKLEAENLPN